MLGKIKKNISINAQAAIGQKLGRKIVVFESDDWGGIRMPSKNTYEVMAGRNPGMEKDRFSRFDSLASADDLSALFEVLLNYKDRKGNPPVFTFNVTTANPDFEQILYHNFDQFFAEPFHKTILRERPDALPVWREGFAEKLYCPQYHGREHVHQGRWLEALRNGAKHVRDAFERNTYGFEPHFDGAEYLLAAYDYADLKEGDYWKDSIDNGLQIFQDFFGFLPESFIPPCYIAPQELIDFLYAKGVFASQGKIFAFLPQGLVKGKRSYTKKIRIAGMNDKTGKVNLVRNCFFEPSHGKGEEWVGNCLNRIRTAFRWGKPAVIDTHRVNYIGSIVESNRTENLALLSTLLREIQKTWDDVEFMSSAELARLYRNRRGYES